MKRDKDIVLFSPYDIYKEYGKRMSEISYDRDVLRAIGQSKYSQN